MTHEPLTHGWSGQSPLFWQGIPPLELLDEDDDEDDELEEDEAAPPPPPAPATPLDELELTSAPALPPVAWGSN
jgi:hypothetical protein